jgi:hypothetical protein
MHRFLAVFLCGILTCSITFAQKVRVDYDHGANFTKYHTYSWGETQAAPEFSQLVQQRIVGQIEENLAERGLKQVETGGDLTVNYQATVKQEVQYTTFGDGGGWGWGSGWGSGWGNGYYGGGISTTTETEIPIGTIVVDLIDPQAKQLVFRGIATDTLSSQAEKNTKKLTKAMHKVFEKYPPKEK